MSQSNRPPLLHVAQMVFNTPLAILPEKLDILLSALGPRLVANPVQLTDFLASGALKSANVPGLTFLPSNLDQIAAFDDDFDEENSQNSRNSSKPYKITDSGVAIIPVKGVLMKKGGFMASVSGSSTYSGIASACSAAMDDSQVKGVLFDIDSPGGTTHGCFELTDQLYSYRGKKPMFAVANDLAASAAYAIASASDKIFLTRTAGVGSVGVFSLHTEQSALDETVGVKYTYVFAGAHKVDGNPHEPLSKSAYASIKAEVDRQYSIFTATVARNRKVEQSAIVNTKAEVWSEDKAMPLLADSVGTYDDALTSLTSRLTNKVSVTMVSSTSGTTQQGDMPMDATELSALIAAEVQKAVAAAFKASVAAAVPGVIGVAGVAAEEDTEDKDEDREKRERKEPEGKKGKKMKASGKKADDYMKSDEPEEEDDKEEEDKEDEKKDKKAAIAAASLAASNSAIEIAELCSLAGHSEMLTKFLSDRKSVADVRKTLHELRAKESAATSVSSHFGSVSSNSLDAIDQQTQALVAGSGGSMTKSAAMTKVIKSNPKLYLKYNQERQVASMTPEGAEQYVNMVRQQIGAFELSAETSSL